MLKTTGISIFIHFSSKRWWGSSQSEVLKPSAPAQQTLILLPFPSKFDAGRWDLVLIRHLVQIWWRSRSPKNCQGIKSQTNSCENETFEGKTVWGLTCSLEFWHWRKENEVFWPQFFTLWYWDSGWDCLPKKILLHIYSLLNWRSRKPQLLLQQPSCCLSAKKGLILSRWQLRTYQASQLTQEFHTFWKLSIHCTVDIVFNL